MIKTVVTESVVITDDLDGSSGPDVATRSFAVNGETRLIELSDANWAALRAAVEPFMGPSRKAGKSAKLSTGPKAKLVTTRPGKASDAEQRKQNREIRRWAAEQEQFKDLPQGGRIPEEVKAAYAAAHTTEATLMPPVEVSVDPNAVPAY